MTVVLKIITEAYRESNNLAIGQSPSAAEQMEGLDMFNRFLKSVYGNEEGDPYDSVYVGNNNVATGTAYNIPSLPSDWYPPDNCRIVFNNTSPQTVNLNPFPEDGERFAINDNSGNFNIYPVTLKGNGSLIAGATSVVMNVAGTIKEYMFRADLSSWMPINDLSLTDTFPFPVEFEDMFILGVALRINPRQGQEMAPDSQRAFGRIMKLFKARYSQTIEKRPEEALLRTSNLRGRRYQGYGPYRNPNQRFNTGY